MAPNVNAKQLLNFVIIINLEAKNSLSDIKSFNEDNVNIVAFGNYRTIKKLMV